MSFIDKIALSKVPRPEMIKIPRSLEAKEMHRRLAKRDFAYFAQYCMGYPLADFHLEWQAKRMEAIRRELNLVFMAMRDSAKTTNFSILFPQWYAGHDVIKEFYQISSNRDASGELNERFDSHLNLPYWQDPQIHYTFDHDGGKKYVRMVDRGVKGYSKSQINLGNGSSFKFRSLAGLKRGPHPHVVVCDDILTDRTYLSDDDIRTKYIDGITPMPTELLMLIGTPQHYQDILHQMFENPRYIKKKYPAILNKENKTVLWESRRDWQWLEYKRMEMGELAFTKEYLCEPIDDESSLFPFEMIKACFNYSRKYGTPRDEGIDYVIGCDLAISDSRDADYTVFTVLGHYTEDDKSKMVIKDIFRKRGIRYSDQLVVLRDLQKKYKPILTYVEDNSFQKIMVQLIEDSPSYYETEGVRTGSDKHRVDLGVPSIRQLLESKQLVIPYKKNDEHTINLTKKLADELQAFSIREGRCHTVAPHDDMVMSLWIAVKAMREIMSQGVSFGFLSLR